MPQTAITDGLPNRVLDAVALHVKDEALFGVNNPGYKNTDPQALELRRRHLEGVLEGFRKYKDLNRLEKKGLKYVRHEIRKIRVKQNPAFLRVLLYAKPLRWLVNLVRGRNTYYNGFNRSMKEYGKEITRNINAANLQETLKEYGFNNQLEGPMIDRMVYSPKEFSIRTPETSKSDTNYLLHFKKNPGSDTYYFAGFDAGPRTTGVYTGKKEPLPMQFRVSDKIQFTAAEAQSLVHGNLVFKKIDGQNTVLSPSKDGTRLNVSQFDLEKNLSGLPIKEMGDATSRELILHELSAGREAFITLQLPQGEEKGLIVSMAKDKSGKGVQLQFRDENGKVDAFDLAKDRSGAQAIIRNINLHPLLKSTNHLHLA